MPFYCAAVYSPDTYWLVDPKKATVMDGDWPARTVLYTSPTSQRYHEWIKHKGCVRYVYMLSMPELLAARRILRPDLSTKEVVSRAEMVGRTLRYVLSDEKYAERQESTKAKMEDLGWQKAETVILGNAEVSQDDAIGGLSSQIVAYVEPDDSTRLFKSKKSAFISPWVHETLLKKCWNSLLSSPSVAQKGSLLEIYIMGRYENRPDMYEIRETPKDHAEAYKVIASLPLYADAKMSGKIPVVRLPTNFPFIDFALGRDYGIQATLSAKHDSKFSKLEDEMKKHRVDYTKVTPFHYQVVTTSREFKPAKKDDHQGKVKLVATELIDIPKLATEVPTEPLRQAISPAPTTVPQVWVKDSVSGTSFEVSPLRPTIDGLKKAIKAESASLKDIDAWRLIVKDPSGTEMDAKAQLLPNVEYTYELPKR